METFGAHNKVWEAVTGM